MTTTSSWKAPAKNVLAKVRRGRLLDKEGQGPQPCWPNPEKSIGIFEAELGSQCCWQVIGPAREAWEKIHPKIKRYLETHTEPISTTTVLWIFRMIGPAPQTSSPTVIFCCEEKIHRKAAWKAVKESNILDDYQGIQLAHLPRAPGSRGVLIPMWSPSGSTGDASEQETFDSGYDEVNYARMQPYLHDADEPPSLQIVDYDATASDGQHSGIELLEPGPGLGAWASIWGSDQSFVHTPLSNIPKSGGRVDGEVIMGFSETVDFIPAKPAYNACVYGIAEGVKSGQSVLVHPPSGLGQARRTTIGGFIEIAGTIFGMTAAHPFADAQYSTIPALDPHNELCFSDSDGSEDEMDSDDKTVTKLENDVHDLATISATATGTSYIGNATIKAPKSWQQFEQGTSEGKGLNIVNDPGLGYLELQSQTKNEKQIGRLFFSSIVEDTRPDLDYALLLMKKLQISPHVETGTISSQIDPLRLPLFTTEENLKNAHFTSVHMKTDSRTYVKGRIDSTAAFIRLPHASRYQEVYSVCFRSSLVQGDCGSWVYGTFPNALHGHIIAGSSDDGFAYIVPAYQVFDDLVRFFTVERQRQYLTPTTHTEQLVAG
jgi:hypothetical protein